MVSRAPAPRHAGLEATLVAGIFFLMHQEVCSVVCRVGGWHLKNLSLVVLPGFS